MSYDLSKPLVIGISSRALFNLEQENKIFEEQGVEAYEAYQVAHENEILQKGAAFQLIKAFLELNNTELGRLVEVIIMTYIIASDQEKESPINHIFPTLYVSVL